MGIYLPHLERDNNNQQVRAKQPCPHCPPGAKPAWPRSKKVSPETLLSRAHLYILILCVVFILPLYSVVGTVERARGGVRTSSGFTVKRSPRAGRRRSEARGGGHPGPRRGAVKPGPKRGVGGRISLSCVMVQALCVPLPIREPSSGCRNMETAAGITLARAMAGATRWAWVLHFLR